MRVFSVKVLIIFLAALLLLTVVADKKKKSPKQKGKPKHMWRQRKPANDNAVAAAPPTTAAVPTPESDENDEEKGNGTCCQDVAELRQSMKYLWYHVKKSSHPIHVHVHDGESGSHGPHSHFGHWRGGSPRKAGSPRRRYDHSHHHGSHHSKYHQISHRSRRYTGKRDTKKSHDHGHMMSGYKRSHDHSHKKSGYRMPHDHSHKHSHDHTGKKSPFFRHFFSHRPDTAGHRHGSGRKSPGKSHGFGHWSPKETHVHIHVNVDQKSHRPDRKSPSSKDEPEYKYARCDFQANNPDDDIIGTIFLRQKPWSRNLEVKIDISVEQQDNSTQQDNSSASTNSSLHGLHVHEFGDFSDGCASFGGHFNPTGEDHGSPGSDPRHVGDWGNVEVSPEGEVFTYVNFTDSFILGPRSLIGRGIVLHAGEDDLGQGGTEGSRTTGSAGARLACCVISWTKPLADDDW